MQGVFKQGNNTSRKTLVKNMLQSSWNLLAAPHDNSSPEDVDTVLMKAKQILYPSFFSTKGLAQDILELTQAEPDVPLNVFISLYPWKENSALKKDSWTNLFGTNVRKGILHSPENLMGDQDPTELPSQLPHQEETIFKCFNEVLMEIESFEKKIMSLNDIDKKDVILISLKDVRAFYIGYKTKILQICKAINEKKKDIAELISLLKPKATMFGEFFPNRRAYRISRKIARHLLSLDNHGALRPKDRNISANHYVSSLPSQEKPRVFFKLDGMPTLQPGKEAMLSSLYRLLNIPVPRTGLLVITGISDDGDSTFYIAQASEAVIGESLKADTSWQGQLETNTNHFTSFCKQALGAILTNPIDGKPDNFVYNKDNHGLVSIDNDEVFYEECLTTKSLLFCIQAMDKPIPRSLSTFLTTLDRKLLLLAWLDELDQKNQKYKDLESVFCFGNARQDFQKQNPYASFRPVQDLLQKPVEFYGLAKPFLESLSLPITISNSLFNSLQAKLSQIIKTLKDNRSHTPQELLAKVSPNLGDYYKTVRSQFLNNPLGAISHIGEKTQKFSQSSEKNYSPAELFLSLSKALKKSRTLNRFVKKYGKMMSEKELLQPETALRELFCLIQVGLTTTKFQNSKEIVDFWYKGRNNFIQEKILIEQWDALFSLLQDPELKWLLSLEKHLTRGWKNAQGEYPKELSDVKGSFIGKRSLSGAMMEAVLDTQSGAFKKDMSLTGRLDVARFPQQNPVFYLKKFPEIPGHEYAATLFMRSLGLEGIPFSELLLLKDPKQGLYPVLLTQAVQGNPLSTIWEDNNKLKSLDPHHTFLLILCSILLNPEDGKGDNYILTPDKKRILPIDHDHLFLPGIIEEKRGFFSKTICTELQSKTVLYCLREMNEPIPKSVAQIFGNLEIDKFLENWLNQLVSVNQKYQTLSPEDYLAKAFDQGTVFRIAFAEESIKNLYSKLYRMKKRLSEQSDITPFDLLKSLEPYVGKLYHTVFHENLTVFERFMKVTDSLYQKDSNSHQISKLNSIQIFKVLDIPQAELINKSFLQKLDPSNFLEKLSLYKADINLKESIYKKILKGEAELKKIDASNSSQNEEKKTLTSLFKRNQEVIAYHNSQFLTVHNLQNTLKTTNVSLQIRLLDLRGSQNFGPHCIETIIAPYFPNLEYLNLSHNPLLKLGMFLHENFKNLKRLVLTHCPNLICLVIASSELDVLEINNNEKFTRIFLDVPNLPSFDFTASQIQESIYLLNNFEKIQIAKPSFDDIEKIIWNAEKFFNQKTDELMSIGEQQVESNYEFYKIEGPLTSMEGRLNIKETELKQNEVKEGFAEEQRRLDEEKLRKDLNYVEETFRLLEKSLDHARELYVKPFEMFKTTTLILQKISELKKKMKEKHKRVELIRKI